MRTKILVLLIALALSANLHAQVSIGELAEPAKGALLDLNKTVKGGLTLSNVKLANLYTIPATFPGMSSPPADVKAKFTGAMVYHTGENNIAAGIYVWNGKNWTPATENCLSVEDLTLTLTASASVVNTDVDFTVSSNASARCAEGATYTWYKAAAGNSYGASFATTNTPNATTQFASAGTYKVKVEMRNSYSSGTKSAEITVIAYVDRYSLTGKPCYDINQTNDTRAATNAPARVATATDFSVAANRSRTYKFHHEAYSNLSITLLSGDEIVKSISQPAASDTQTGDKEFTLTFKNNVATLVNGSAYSVKLLASYFDKHGALKLTDMEISVQDGLCGCPVKVPVAGHPSGWLTFQCHNLGATDIFSSTGTITLAHHGDYYRFGAKTASLVNTGNNNSAVGGWSTNSELFPFQEDSENWDVANNPCPAGWRVPNSDEYNWMMDNNSSAYIGTCSESFTNFNSAKMFGDYLILPSGGYRMGGDGRLSRRGNYGYYWCSNADGSSGRFLYFSNGIQNALEKCDRRDGYSVRCVAAE
jgi:uncharacterized protein (TIGR02145 family)